MMKKHLLLLALGTFLVLVSCEKDPIDETPMDDDMEATCDTAGITYDDDIKSLFSGCQGSSCHGSGSGREMTDYTTTKAYAEQGRILGALNRDAGFSPMPKNGAKFSQCNIDKVKAWIDNDFPEN